MPHDSKGRRYLSKRESLQLHLAAIRSEQSEGKGPWEDAYTPLGGDLRGPGGDGYERLVAAALSYAWTWRGNRGP